MEVFYRYDIGNEDIPKTSKEILSNRKFSEAGKEFFQRLVDTTFTNLNNIDAVIETTLQHWTLARLAGIDRAIIRIAVCELMYLTDVPPKVVINEAVEIAKKFGAEESPRFINGVLDAIYKKTANSK